MAHIKDLQLNILQRVLAYFYDGVRYDGICEFKQLLPPAAVCRVWRECMLPYVYRTAYIEYYIKDTEEDNEAAQPEYEWKSNIDLIVSQQFSSLIKRLRIESVECPLSFSDMIHALDAFGFSSSHWRAVKVLFIDAVYGVVANDGAPSSSGDEALATQLTEYFGQHLPNIGDLFIDCTPEANVSRLLSNKLVNLYINQLHSIYCHPIPIAFKCNSFSPSLRRLEASIASVVINRFPQLLASPLECLNLSNVRHSFIWRSFIGTAPDHVEFTNLRRLCLHFGQQSVSTEESDDSGGQVCASTMKFNIGDRKLYFPVLKSLIIANSPYSDGALYSMFIHSPLQSVRISSSFKSLQHMDPRILFNAADVLFEIDSVSADDYNGYVEFYCKLLGTPSNVRDAWLGVSQSSAPLPIPSTIEWTNLRYLTLAASIHLDSVIQVMTQLRKLHTLRVENVVDEVNEAGANLKAILEGSTTQMLSITTRIKNFSIYSPPRLPLAFNLDVMCYLAILVHSLDEVAVPDLCVSDVKEFAAHHADAFPHLHRMKVLGASEEDY